MHVAAPTPAPHTTDQTSTHTHETNLERPVGPPLYPVLIANTPECVVIKRRVLRRAIRRHPREGDHRHRRGRVHRNEANSNHQTQRGQAQGCYHLRGCGGERLDVDLRRTIVWCFNRAIHTDIHICRCMSNRARRSVTHKNVVQITSVLQPHTFCRNQDYYSGMSELALHSPKGWCRADTSTFTVRRQQWRCARFRCDIP